MKLTLTSFPMLTLPVAIYNLVAAFTSYAPDVFGGTADAMNGTVLTLPTVSSGTQLPLSLGVLILLIGLFALFVELVSSTRSSDEALLGDALTLILFVICLIEFLLLPAFATGTFLLLVIMVMMDSLAGFIVSAVSARKDIEMGA